MNGKKLLALLLALALSVGLCPAALAAEEVASGKCGDNVAWRLDSAGTLTISGTGPMWDYDYERSGGLLMKIDLPDGQTGVVYRGLVTTAPWSDYNGAVKKIVVEEGVTAVGRYAFCGLPCAREVTLPESLERLGRGAFYSCVYLGGVVIPDGVTELEEYVFTECFWLRSAVVGAGVKSLYGTFDGDMGLEQVTLPEGLESVGDRCFYGCKALKDVDLPASLVSIGQYAFYETGLTGTVSLGPSLQSIGQAAFGASIEVTAFELDAANPTLYGANGGVVERESGKMVLLPCGLTSYVVPDGVKEIAPGLFDGAHKLERVVLPEGLEHIGDEAFWDCLSLRELKLPSTLKTIGRKAFRLTRSLTELELPEGLQAIGDYAFHYSALRRIRVPDSVTSLGDCAFRGCDNLELAELGSGVTSIENYFMECPGLRAVVLPASLQSVHGWSFEYEWLLQDVYYHGTAEDWAAVDIYKGGNGPLEEAALHPAGTWTEADVETPRRGSGEITWRLAQNDDVLIISGEGPMPDYDKEGENAAPWADIMWSVNAVIVEEGVTYLGSYAFYNDLNLHALSLPSTLRSIGPHALSLYAEDRFDGGPTGTMTQSKDYDHLYFGGSSAQWSRIALPEGYLGLQYALIRYHVQDRPFDYWLTAEQALELSGPLPGDVDLDGAVTAADARALFTLVSTGAAAPAGADPDVNGDGKVNDRDALLAFRMAVS